MAPIPLETADPAGFADQAFPSRHRWTPRLLDIVTRSPTVTANHGSERGLLTRGSTGRISVAWFIAPFGRADMTDNRPLLRRRVWIRDRRHGGGRQNGGKSKPCKQGCGAAKQSLWYSRRVRRKQTRATHALMVRRMLMTPVVVMMRIPTATIAPTMQMRMMTHERNHLFQN